jgi:hypothetical protein
VWNVEREGSFKRDGGSAVKMAADLATARQIIYCLQFKSQVGIWQS